MPGTPTAPRNATRVTYDATDNGDGTFTIHDVPILHEIPAGARGNEDEIGKAWMLAALARHAEQLVSGYVAPVHAGHNGRGGEALALGTFVPLAVRRMEIEGLGRWCLFADVTVDQETLASIRAGRWPYRSIEVDWDAGIVGSLALLSGASPHCRFPMLRDVRILNQRRADLADAIPAVADAPRAEGYVDATARMRARALVRLAAYAKAGDEGDGDDPDEGEGGPTQKSGNGDGDEDPAKTEDPVSKALAGFGAILTRILEAVVGKKTEDRAQTARDESPEDSGDQTGDDEDEDTENDPDGKDSKEKKNMGAPATTTLDADTKAKLAQLDTLTGKVTALEAENTALKADVKTLREKNEKAERAALATKAKERLRAKRVIVPATFDADFEELHAASPALAEKHVATLLTNGRQDPPNTLADEMQLRSEASDEPEVVAHITKLTAKGMDALAAQEVCRKTAAEWRAHKAAVPGSPVTLETHLRINAKVPA